MPSLVGSEMCIRESTNSVYTASGEGFGSSVPDAKLLIRQLDMEVGNGKGTVEPGVGGKLGF